jgi:KaiC/GvpD/RAD55 family RecA-like ATPase
MELLRTGRLADGDHVVTFYDGAGRLTEFVINYLATAVGEGDTVIVIATQEHREAFAAALTSAGIDVHEALCTMRVRLFDATEMLSRFMHNDKVDLHAFTESVGFCVREAVAEGRPVRAFGEMVALLWADGNKSAAIELERVWNVLGDQIPFSLLCAYPQSIADDGDSDFSSMCDEHSHVVNNAAAAM